MESQGIIRIIAGLGNPGPQYEWTYHNAGALAASHLLEAHSKAWARSASRTFAYARFPRFTLVRPLVFMNESGGAIKAALSRFKAKPEELLVIHDESDLGLGDAKFSFNRGAAGHRGVRSVIDALGVKRFWRLRIGVRPMGEVERTGRTGLADDVRRRVKAGDFVLKQITARDKEKLYRAFDAAIVKLIANTTPSDPVRISERGRFTD